MMDEPNPSRVRFQFSVRTLWVVTAVLACLMLPLAWSMRERERQTALLQAREVAIHSAVLEERRRVEAVKARENAALQARIESLRREIEALKATKHRK